MRRLVIQEDRRAPILARHEVQADPRRLRQSLRQIERDLDEVSEKTRRNVVLLVGALANHWARHRWSREGHSMTLDIEHLSNRVRVEAFSHANPPATFWRQVGSSVAPGLVVHWGVERRHRPGVWFEVSAEPNP